MKLSQAQIHQVVNELIHNSRYPLEKSCIDLLRIINENIIDSKTLGHFEKEGIDAYTYDPHKNKYLKAFQFKGFEVMEFGESQKKQCLKSINSFCKSNKPFEEYYLITNLPIKNNSLRKEIEDEIKVKTKNKKALLLDVNQFVKFLLENYTPIVIKSIEKYNEKIIDQYEKTVEQKFYYDNVPFTISGDKLKSNPRQYLFKNAYNEKNSKLNFSKWKFIISEFGFGKTALVQNLISMFKSSGIESIYLPISSLSSEGLSNTTKISKEIAELIFESKMDFVNGLPEKLLFSIIKKTISSSNKMVIIFDGLDEHNFSYKLTGLRHIFTSLTDITAPIFISMRKEFWEERQEDIKLTLSKPDKNVATIELVEWSDSNILEFLNLFQKAEVETKKLDWFKNLLKNNTYENHFGDIPKRPLFLKMLLKDLMEGNPATNNISLLYQNYFIEKLKIDISGYYGASTRPLNIDGGIITQANNIISLLKSISFKMISIVDKSNISLKEFVFEKDIESILLTGKINDILEILMHSVLMPFGAKELTGFKLKFAHKSYQEYFLAKFVFDEIFNIENSELDEDYNFPKTVRDFIESMLLAKEINLSEIQSKSNWRIIYDIVNNPSTAYNSLYKK